MKCCDPHGRYMASVLIDRIMDLPKYMGEINAKSYVGYVLKYRVLVCVGSMSGCG